MSNDSGVNKSVSRKEKVTDLGKEKGFFVTFAFRLQKIQQWWFEYNTLRPHSHLGYLPPNEYEIENQNFYLKTVAA